VTARSQCEQVMPFTSNVWFMESLFASSIDKA
jgi:hypothetical protein